MLDTQFAAERPQFFAHPAVNRRRRQRPQAGPAYAVVFQRDRCEEFTGLQRPAPGIGRDRAKARERLDQTRRGMVLRLITHIGHAEQCGRDLPAGREGRATEVRAVVIVAVARLSQSTVAPARFLGRRRQAQIGVTVDLEILRMNGRQCHRTEAPNQANETHVRANYARATRHFRPEMHQRPLQAVHVR